MGKRAHERGIAAVPRRLEEEVAESRCSSGRRVPYRLASKI